MALWKSFTECFWPIFGLLENYEDCDPFVIGLYVGMSKPTNTDEYLQPVIDDNYLNHYKMALCSLVEV